MIVKSKIKNFKFHFLKPKFFSNSKLPMESELKSYINYVRKNAHKFSVLDPLNLNNTKPSNEFNPEYWNISEIDKVENFPVDYTFGHQIGNLDTVKDLKEYLTKNYLKSVGVEFEHLDSETEKLWLYENYEKAISKELTKMELVNSLKILLSGELFEVFLKNKVPTFKRYSGEGMMSTLIGLNALFSECSKKSSLFSSVVLGMPHRGRLNILPIIFDYPLVNLLAKISGKRDIPQEVAGIDDVVHHVSVSNTKTFFLDGNLSDHRNITVTMLHNPSHLEAAYPCAMGKALAKQRDLTDNTNVLNVVLHGDAALSGQGIIMEALSIHKTPECYIGGTVHIVNNNQIGYTTEKNCGRSTRHCTDIFKGYDIPVIHVNADEVESVIKVFRFVLEYRQKFKKDIAIDMIGLLFSIIAQF